MRQAWLAVALTSLASLGQAQFPASPASDTAVRQNYAEVEACNQQVAKTGRRYCQTSSGEAWVPIARINNGRSELKRWQHLARAKTPVSCFEGMCQQYFLLPTVVPDLVACTVVAVRNRTGPPFFCRHVAVKLRDGWWLEGLVDTDYVTHETRLDTEVTMRSTTTLVQPNRLPSSAFDAAAPEKIQQAVIRELERSLRLKWHLATELRPSGEWAESVHGVSGKRPSVLLAPYREDIGVSVFVQLSGGAIGEIETPDHRRYRTKPISLAPDISSHRDGGDSSHVMIRPRLSAEIAVDAILDIDVSRYATDDPTKWHALSGEQLRIMREALNGMLRDAVRRACGTQSLAFADTATNSWRCSYWTPSSPPRP